MRCCGTDVCDVTCPKCEASMNLQDVQTDGCLRSGFEFECPECDAQLVIAAVDWDPTIWLSIREPNQTPDPGAKP